MAVKFSDFISSPDAHRTKKQDEFRLLKTSGQPTLKTPLSLEMPVDAGLSSGRTEQNSDSRSIAALSSRIGSTNGENALRKDGELNSYELKNKKGAAYNGDPSTIDKNEVYGIKIPVGQNDTGEAILLNGYKTAAFFVCGDNVEAERIARQMMDERGADLKNVNSKTWQFGDTKSNTELNVMRRNGKMSFYITGGDLKRFDQIHAQKLVMDALQSGEMPNDALLTRAGADKEALSVALNEVGWQPVPTFDEAIEKRAAEKKVEILAWRDRAQKSAAIDTSFTNSKWYGMTDVQITAETKLEAETEVKRAVGKGELIVRSDNKPPTIGPSDYPQWRTNGKLFIEKYLPGLADINTPEGIKTTNVEAFVYGWINARTFGATDFYVDKSRFNNERQATEAWAMQKLGMITGEFQNLAKAGKTVEAIMNTPRVSKAVIALNESGILGKTLVNALPSAVTFGSVETVREGVKTATGQSEGIRQAVANITRASAEGAVFGVFQPLPLQARIPAVAASSYGIEKVFGADNQEAAQTALLNSIFALAGGRSQAAQELNGKTIRITNESGAAANVRLAIEPNGRVRLVELPQSFKADLQVKIAELKSAVQNIAGKVKPSEVMIDATTGQRVAVPKRSVNELLQDPLFRVKSGEEFRQRYGAEVTKNLKVRTALGKIEQVADKADQLKQLQTLEADVLLTRVEPTKLSQITKQAQTNQDFMRRCGNVNETLSTDATPAKKEVDGANTRLAKGKGVGKYGKPDNIQVDADKKIVEVEEVKFFGLKKLEALGAIAKSDPETFVTIEVNKNIGNGYVQFDKHIQTINAIKADLTKVDGIEVKGVADKVKYVFTIPKLEGAEFLRANQALKEMQKAWKSQLNIDVEIRYSDFSTTDIQQITQRLEQKGGNKQK